jgi:hypothetical protein
MLGEQLAAILNEKRRGDLNVFYEPAVKHPFAAVVGHRTQPLTLMVAQQLSFTDPQLGGAIVNEVLFQWIEPRRLNWRSG